MILELLSSSAVGTALGGVFSFLTKVEERKTLAVKMAHEKDMAAIRKEEIALTNAHQLAIADKNMQAAEVAGKIEQAKQELQNFATSIIEGNKKSGVAWADAVATLMRPAITGALFALTVWLAFKLSLRMDALKALDESQVVAMWKHLIMELVFLTSTAISWWFGSRPSSLRK